MNTSRMSIIKWINTYFDPKCTKIEELGTGGIYCQIINSIFGSVPMNKVKFNANQEFQYIHNFKILQAAFDKNGLDRPINVRRLILCRFQDNLEFIQWMYSLWISHSVSMEPISGSSPLLGIEKQTISTKPTSTQADLEANIARVMSTLEEVEKERNFYFEKLRKVEDVLQNNTAGSKESLVAELLTILYEGQL